ncbi:hypothetical protein FB45DRAFT_1035541 [Roridomyces roridus]|uniref:Uncharacterized protein n=1 Tax=Roridomyces roridus TaxID=1738132 RepID=A0AAD7FCD8_9AGAR|nr:hypothetical protein FB45DRAFT_1035541 [Roridomyces roridus]
MTHIAVGMHSQYDTVTSTLQAAPGVTANSNSERTMPDHQIDDENERLLQAKLESLEACTKERLKEIPIIAAALARGLHKPKNPEHEKKLEEILFSARVQQERALKDQYGAASKPNPYRGMFGDLEVQLRIAQQREAEAVASMKRTLMEMGLWPEEGIGSSSHLPDTFVAETEDYIADTEDEAATS